MMPNFTDGPWIDSSLGRVRVILGTTWNPEYSGEFVYSISTDTIYREDGLQDAEFYTPSPYWNLGETWRRSSVWAQPATVPSRVAPPSTSSAYDCLSVGGITSLGNGSVTAYMHIDHRRVADVLMTVTFGSTTTSDTGLLGTFQIPNPPGASTTADANDGWIGDPNLINVMTAVSGAYGWFFDSSAGLSYPMLFDGYAFRTVNAASAASATGLASGLPATGAGDILSMGLRFALRNTAVFNAPQFH